MAAKKQYSVNNLADEFPIVDTKELLPIYLSDFSLINDAEITFPIIRNKSGIIRAEDFSHSHSPDCK